MTARSPYTDSILTFFTQVNNIAGPALTQIPFLFHSAGFLTPLITVIVLTLGSCIAALMLCEAMRVIPGNREYFLRYEYTSIVRHYFGGQGRFFWFTLALLCVNLLSITIASIVQVLGT